LTVWTDSNYGVSILRFGIRRVPVLVSRVTAGSATAGLVIALFIVLPGFKSLTRRPFVIREPISFVNDEVFTVETVYNSSVTGKTS